MIQPLFMQYGWDRIISIVQFMEVKFNLPKARKDLNALKKLRKQMNETNSFRDAVRTTLKLPRNGDNLDMRIKPVWSTFGKVEGEDLESTWRRIIFYGHSKDWAHSTYKQALGIILTGTAAEHFDNIQDKSLQTILSSLTDRYLSKTMSGKQSLLRNFTRIAGEKLHIALSRYNTLLINTEGSVPFREREVRRKTKLIECNLQRCWKESYPRSQSPS